MEFESVYRGYVIKDMSNDMFVGPTSDMYRVLSRYMAIRFIKEEAVNYIQTSLFCKDGNFVIEAAT